MPCIVLSAILIYPHKHSYLWNLHLIRNIQFFICWHSNFLFSFIQIHHNNDLPPFLSTLLTIPRAAVVTTPFSCFSIRGSPVDLALTSANAHVLHVSLTHWLNCLGPITLPRTPTCVCFGSSLLHHTTHTSTRCQCTWSASLSKILDSPEIEGSEWERSVSDCHLPVNCYF